MTVTGRIAYCTYFDLNYLTRGLALYESLKRFDPNLSFWALCLDGDTARCLDTLRLPGIRVVTLEAIEGWAPDLIEARPGRSRVEYYFTLTPFLPLFVLEHDSTVGISAYVDADLYFYSDPTPVIRMLEGGSVLIVPHGFPAHLSHLERFGKFNVGLVGFRRTAAALACLRTWRQQCLEWCFDRVESGRFADQAYLNEWPDGVPGTIVVDRPGVGLGPWNFMRYEIDVDLIAPRINGDALVYYHFQGLQELWSHVWDTGLAGFGRMEPKVRRRLYGDYIATLDSWAARVRVTAGAATTLRADSRRDRASRLRRAIRAAARRQITLSLRGRAM